MVGIIKMNASRAIPKFDSATTILQALSRYLHGKDMGMASPVQMMVAGLNPFPRKVRELAYTWGGWGGAVAPRKIHTLRAEDIARWVVGQYPRHPFSPARERKIKNLKFL